MYDSLNFHFMNIAPVRRLELYISVIDLFFFFISEYYFEPARTHLHLCILMITSMYVEEPEKANKKGTSSSKERGRLSIFIK